MNVEPNKKHIDDFFGEKLGSYREAPPGDVWDTLDKRLDTLQPAPSVPSSSYRWLWHAAMVSVIGVLSVSVVKKYTDAPDGNKSVAEVVSTAATPAAEATNTSSPDANSMAAETDQASPSQDAPGADNTSNAGEQNTGGSTNVGSSATTADHEAIATHGTTSPAHKATAASTKSNHIASGAQYDAGNTGSSFAAAQPNAGNRFNARGPRAAQSANSQAAFAESFGGKDNAVTQSAERKTFSSGNGIAGNTDKTHIATPQTDVLNASGKGTTQENKLPGTFKKDVIEEKAKIAEKAKDVKSSQKGPFKFEYGVKAGYETGFAVYAANKYVLSPYLQYNITDKVAIMTQPAVKVATLAERTVGNTHSYITNKSAGNAQLVDLRDSLGNQIGGNPAPHYAVSTYNYSQTHDSVAKYRTTGGTYVELEVPVLAKYKVSKHLSAYGGPSVNYSKLPAVKEQTYTQTNINVSVTATNTTPGATPAPLPVSQVITYNTPGAIDYTSPSYSSAGKGRLGVGYMLGISYECSNKWLFDALVQQTPVKPDQKDGYDANKPLSTPYFRFTVGYKITR